MTSRPLVIVPHGERSVAFLQLVAAAEDLCDLAWLVHSDEPDGGVPPRLLRRFGPVVDGAGKDEVSLADEVAALGPQGVVAFRDADLVRVARIAARLGLPFHSPAVARRLADKVEQRRALRAAGLPVPRVWEIPAHPDPALVTDLTTRITYPVVLKPRVGSGSRHTFLVHDAWELRTVLAWLEETPEPLVAEEYLRSHPDAERDPFADYVSVETVADGTGHHHVAVTGRLRPAPPFRETGFFIPSTLAAGEQEDLRALASAALGALGVEVGCVHTEIKLTPDGPRVLEVNGRMGGGVHEMLHVAAGADLLRACLQVALREPTGLTGPLDCRRIGYRLFLQPPASARRVRSIDGLQEVADLPGVESVSVHLGPGETVDAREGSRAFVVAVVGCADTHDQVLAVDRRMYQLTDIDYENEGAPARPRAPRGRRTGEGRAGGGGTSVAPAARGCGGPPRLPAAPALEIALVNNMPDAAFEEAERQFTRLLLAGAGSTRVEVRLTTLPEPGRSEPVRRRLAARYEDLAELYERPPDAVVVTGSEPRATRLDDEPLWPALAELVRWSVESTTSLACSCLAAHGALLALDGVDRRRLGTKASGVYVQSVRGGHPLTAGVGPVSCPHSRHYDVPAAMLEAAGYAILLASGEAGWSIAVRDDPVLVLLLQGHPEYSRTTLLREYRRDVGRYLAGVRALYPNVPDGYLDTQGMALAEAFRLRATGPGAGADRDLLAAFPFDALACRIEAEWRSPMDRLVANWLDEVHAHKLSHSLRRTG